MTLPGSHPDCGSTAGLHPNMTRHCKRCGARWRVRSSQESYAEADHNLPAPLPRKTAVKL